MLVLVFGVQATYNYTTNGSVLGEKDNLSTAQLLEYTNEERVKEGLAPLENHAGLEQAAKLKAYDILNRQYWSHSAPDGTGPWTFIDEVGYRYEAAGENLARNFSSSEATVAAWMASDGHRANILKEGYTDVGFAVAYGMLDGYHSAIVVAFYGRPETGTVAGMAAPITTVASAGAISPITRFGIALQSLTPAAIGSLVLVLTALIVALVAHRYRNRLPKRLQKTWYRHHGLIKSIGLICLAALMIVLYGGGSL